MIMSKYIQKLKKLELDKTKFLFVPWINSENEEKTLQLIEE